MQQRTPKKSYSAKALLRFAKEAKELNVSGPRDLAFNHDFYTWGGEKKVYKKNNK